MIPRIATRRIASSGLVIVPRTGDRDLPAWSPVAPRGGWNPTAAFRASVEYVEALDRHERGASERRLVLAVYRDLLAALPGVKRAEIGQRLERVVQITKKIADERAPF